MSRLRIAAGRAVVLAALTVAVPGAEVVRRDLALAVEALPVAFDYDLTGPGIARSGSDEFDLALGLRGGARWSFSDPGAAGAWVAGLDARLGHAEYGSGGYQTIGLGASFGYAYAIDRRWTLLAEPLAEIGWATLSFPGSGTIEGFTADGSHTAFGLRAGVLYALSERWLLDGSLSWLQIASATSTSGGRSFDIEQSGVVVAVGAVWRWSGAPARLE